jgi:hypothetical protein
MSELYVLPFFKFLTFTLTIWGKGLVYMFLGFFVFDTSGVGLFAAIVFWILAVLYVIMFFIAGIASLPLLQKNIPPQFQTCANDYFGEGGGNSTPKDHQKSESETPAVQDTSVA